MKLIQIFRKVHFLIHICILFTFSMFIFMSCDLLEDPEKTCNETITYDKNFKVHELYKGGDLIEIFHAIEDICPDNSLVATCTLTSKSDDFYNDVISIKLIWIYYYPPKLEICHKDYIYLLRNGDNPNLWNGTQVLLPYELGFSSDLPATIDFEVNIKLLNAMSDNDIYSWTKKNIKNIELKIEYTKF